MNIFAPDDARSHPISDFVFPATALVMIVIADHYSITGAVTTPTLNFLMMGLLAMYLSPIYMAFWALVYTSVSVWMLYHLNFSQPGLINTTLNFNTRSIGALVGGGIAFVLCMTRARAAGNHEQLLLFLKRIPIPVVVSDRNGVILFISKEASEWMGISNEAAAAQSYFALFMNVSDQGTAVQKYLTMLDGKGSEESIIRLKMINRPEDAYAGILMPINLTQGRCLITVIKPSAQSEAPEP